MAPQALVVDDDELVSTTLVSMLARAGVEASVQPPTDGFIDRIISARPHMLLLDLALKRSDAIEVMRALAEAEFAGRILLVSGREIAAIESVHLVGVKLGLKMLSPLAKPVKASVLAARLEEARLPGRESPSAVLFDMQEALAKGWLQVCYQPRVNIGTRTLQGAEASLQLQHPELGAVSGENLLPTNSADPQSELLCLLLERALGDFQTFHKLAGNLKLSFGATLSALARPAFLDSLRKTLARVKTPPKIMVCLDEDTGFSDMDTARELALQLVLYDVMLSVNHFGKGNASFERISDLPFMEVVLDEKFVRGAAGDERQKAICQATALLARKFSIDCVAKGVDDKADLALLASLGFNTGLGRLFGAPMPREHFARMLQKIQHRRRASDQAAEAPPAAAQ